MSEKDMKLGGAAAQRFAAKPGSLSEDAGITPVGGSAYANDISGVYKSSDDVRKHYYELDQHQQQQQQQQETVSSSSASATPPPLQTEANSTARQETNTGSTSSSLPPLWADRQKERDIQAKQYGVFSSKNMNAPAAASQQYPQSSTAGAGGSKNSLRTTTNEEENSPSSAEVALVQVTTHTLEMLAKTLSLSKSTTTIPLEDKEALAQAIRRAMEAVAKS
jgi:hypothetical protein